MILLDTQAWVWWRTKPDKLGRKAKQTIARNDRRTIAAMSVWEVAMIARAGKIRFDDPVEMWVEYALHDEQAVELLPLSPTIAVLATRLQWRHADPADRMIVATALTHNVPLVTADEAMHESGLVKCIWD